MTQRKLIICFLSLLLLGCGQQGALYLPESQSTETQSPEASSPNTEQPATDEKPSLR